MTQTFTVNKGLLIQEAMEFNKTKAAVGAGVAGAAAFGANKYFNKPKVTETPNSNVVKNVTETKSNVDTSTTDKILGTSKVEDVGPTVSNAKKASELATSGHGPTVEKALDKAIDMDYMPDA